MALIRTFLPKMLVKGLFKITWEFGINPIVKEPLPYGYGPCLMAFKLIMKNSLMYIVLLLLS